MSYPANFVKTLEVKPNEIIQIRRTGEIITNHSPQSIHIPGLWEGDVNRLKKLPLIHRIKKALFAKIFAKIFSQK